jgi:hypothetical protein
LLPLVDVLEKKGVLTSEEWEKEIKYKIEASAKTLTHQYQVKKSMLRTS